MEAEALNARTKALNARAGERSCKCESKSCNCKSKSRSSECESGSESSECKSGSERSECENGALFSFIISCPALGKVSVSGVNSVLFIALCLCTHPVSICSPSHFSGHIRSRRESVSLLIPDHAEHRAEPSRAGPLRVRDYMFFFFRSRTEAPCFPAGRAEAMTRIRLGVCGWFPEQAECR